MIINQIFLIYMVIFLFFINNFQELQNEKKEKKERLTMYISIQTIFVKVAAIA